MNDQTAQPEQKTQPDEQRSSAPLNAVVRRRSPRRPRYRNPYLYLGAAASQPPLVAEASVSVKIPAETIAAMPQPQRDALMLGLSRVLGSSV